MLAITLLPTTTPSSVAFSNSYLQRASGIEASYWNPANINDKQYGAEYMFLSLSAGAGNNFLTLKPFLKGEGNDLENNDKNAIIGKLFRSGTVNGHAQLIIMGMSLDKWSFSTSSNVHGYGRIDKRYLKIALFGNDLGVKYDLSKNTGFGALGYEDLTVGYGGVSINDYFPDQMSDTPEILFGFSASYLFGGYMLELDKFVSKFAFQFNDDGDQSTLDQVAVLRKSSIGHGFKMNVGVSSVLLNYSERHFLTTGISFDNLLGFIHWRNNDFSSIFYNGSFTSFETDQFDYEGNSFYTTHFPITFRFGSKYVYKDLSLSADYEQNLWKHPAFSYDPEVSFGVEQVLFKRWPIQFGYRLPLLDYVPAYSFGTGYRFNTVEFGLSLKIDQSEHYRHIKGASIGMFTKIRYDW